jgi:hypothetical protein
MFGAHFTAGIEMRKIVTCLILVVLSLPATAGQEVLRILPIGGSITQGAHPWQTYRYPLWKGLVDAGIPVTFVGSKTGNLDQDSSYPNYLGHEFPRNHEGHNGWRASDFLDGCLETDRCFSTTEGTLFQWINGYTPDIALLFIGTDDILQRNDYLNTAISVWFIIEVLRADNPDVTILLAKIPTLLGRDIPVRILNFLYDLVADLSTTERSPVRTVDLYSGFNLQQDTYDLVHPNQSGEAKISAQFLSAILVNTNNPPSVDAGPDFSMKWLKDTASLSGIATDGAPPLPPGHLTLNWSKVSGPGTVNFAASDSAVTAVTFSWPGTYVLSLTANDGVNEVSDSVTVQVLPVSCDDIFVESGGAATFEAENYLTKSVGTGNLPAANWVQSTEQSGYSGEGAMGSTFLGNSSALSGDTTQGAALNYMVRFTSTGTYYAWARMLGPGGSANSIHAGFSDDPLTFGLRGMEVSIGGWHWVNLAAGDRVSFSVASPGDYTFNLWMREDGTYVDKVVLTKNSGFTPFGVGPDQSATATQCDVDDDGMEDAWEAEHFRSLQLVGNQHSDTDLFCNCDEYIAGTDPNDAESYPRITAMDASDRIVLTIPSKPGRDYTVEFTDDPIGQGSWQILAADVPGKDGELEVSDPNPVRQRIYRYRARKPTERTGM